MAYKQLPTEINWLDKSQRERVPLPFPSGALDTIALLPDTFVSIKHDKCQSNVSKDFTEE